MIHRILPVLIFVATLMGACGPAEEADLILFNGKVVTVDENFSIVEAVALKGDRILATGSSEEILDFAGSATEKIDLEGKMMLPGLIDSHVHAMGSAMHEFDHVVPDMESISDVLDYVSQRAEKLGPDKWVYVSQVFITRLREQRYPTREELDKAAPHNPVVFRTGPDASLNTLALEVSGIDKDFEVTDGKPCLVERDSSGEPTGILRQCRRFIKVVDPSARPTDEDRLERLKALFADYNSVGITSLGEGNTSDHALKLLETLRDSGELSVRVFSYLAVNGQDSIEDIEARIKQAAQSPLHEYNNMLWLRGAKVFMDGGMLTGSAYMRQPWGISEIYSITDPDYRGMRYIEPDKFHQIMKTALENEIQLTAHCVGDAAVETFVNTAVRLAEEGVDVRAGRPCLTHSNFMTLSAIENMARLNIVANMQPNWLQLDGATLLKHFGEERTEYFQPYRTIFDKGAIVGGGSDHMQKIGSFRSINQYNPFLGMWTTLARSPRWMEGGFHPEQIITREEAVRLYTINNAFLTFEEDMKGSIEPGKLADLIVIDRDLLECSLDEIPDTRVERTYLGGRLVWQR